MAMAAQDKRRIEQILASARFARNPLFFFDTSFLLANVTLLAGWNQTRLEAVIAPQVTPAIATGDSNRLWTLGGLVAQTTE